VTGLLAAAACGAAALSRDELLARYAEGAAYFRQGNEAAAAAPDRARELFRQAAMHFESLIREGGIRNGRLYYNLGNAYFRMDDIGRAILNYRRALQYLPNDLNVRQNLAYARARRLDSFREEEHRRVLKTLLVFHYDLTRRVRAHLFAFAFAFAWAFLAVSLFSRRRVWRWAAGISAAVALTMVTSLVAESAALASRQPGVVVAREVVARKGDSTTYEPTFTEPLHAGTEFAVLEDRGDWLNVRLPDGKTCWLPAGSTELVR
jgi:tetratricopeptide (TPR) repeat protein